MFDRGNDMMKRREFLSSGSLAGFGLPLYASHALAAQKNDEKTTKYHDPGWILVRDGIKRAKKGKKKTSTILWRLKKEAF